MTCPIEEISAHGAQDEIRNHHDGNPKHQHPQRLNRTVGYDTIVDIHGEDRQCQSKNVDQESRQHDIAVEAAVLSQRSKEHTSELQSLMRISYAVFCLKT